MPKSLHEWLHYQALKWMMPTEAVQAYHGKTWHKLTGKDAWTECGRWVSGVNLRARAGFAEHRNKLRSPWWGDGHLAIPHLCRTCFADELPLLIELQRIAIDGQPEGPKCEHSLLGANR